jgi:hypothetical protein
VAASLLLLAGCAHGGIAAAVAELPPVAPQPATSDIERVAQLGLTEALSGSTAWLPAARPLLLHRDTPLITARIVPRGVGPPIAIVTGWQLTRLRWRFGKVEYLRLGVKLEGGRAWVSVSTAVDGPLLDQLFCCAGNAFTYERDDRGEWKLTGQSVWMN